MFVRIATQHSDYWGRGYCGYWAQAVSAGDYVWLIYEHNDRSNDDSTIVEEMYHNGTPLPKG